ASRPGTRIVGFQYRRRAVRAWRLWTARYRGGRGRHRGDLRGPARPRPRKSARRGVVRAAGYADPDAGGARWACRRHRRRARAVPALRPWWGGGCDRAVGRGRRRDHVRRAGTPALAGCRAGPWQSTGRIVLASLAMALVLIGLQWGLAAIPASSV